MSVLLHELQEILPPPSTVPVAIRELFTWLEQRNLVRARRGCHYGILHPLEDVQSTWNAPERVGGTYVEFFADSDPYFRAATPEVNGRLTVFAKTGGDGSYAAFWIDDDGQQKIVHLGSGSGSTLLCVLADTAVDFLRLLAIGYSEICWPEQFSELPNARSSEQRILPNHAFRSWVETTFAVAIPRTASEIVRWPAGMDDKDSPDPFWRWARDNS